MSYRKPEIIQNQSGLIVPQAIAKAAENISQAWSKQLSDQRKLNLARREEDRKNDLGVEQATANAMAALKKGAGGETLVNTARESQVEIINDLDEILKELNNRNLDPSRKKILRAAELELRNGLTDMNATFGKISTTMTAAKDFNINKAGNLGKKTATTKENLIFGLGLDKGEATYNYTGYKRDNDGALILGGNNKVGLSITSGGVTVQANQFTSDGWTAITDVTQVQPDIDLAVKNTLTGKGGVINQNAVKPATYETKIPVYNKKGEKEGTRTDTTQDATDATNKFLNEQTQLAFAAIQAGQNPVETRNILKNQYNMSETDIDTFLNTKKAAKGTPALQYQPGGLLPANTIKRAVMGADLMAVNNKLRFSIAQTIGNPLDFSITNPNDTSGGYTFGIVKRGAKSTPSSSGSNSELDTRISYSKGRFKETNTNNPDMSAADLFETAGNFAVGKSLKIGNTYQDVRGVSKNGNTVNIAYGTGPDFVSYTGEDKEFLKKFEAARNNPAAYLKVIDPNTNLEVDVTFGTELKRRKIVDRKMLVIDLSDKIKSLPGIRKAFNITEKAAGELWDSYFKPKFTPATP
tara:strand:+ start:150 stop:1892 length:1743 start_codon:yes stop_codon:yes gene_type:complete